MDVGTDVDPKLITESIEGSLQRLGLDYVDIYYLVSVGSREVTLHEPYIKARETLRSWTSAEVTCRSCATCEVKCSLGFDVKSRALDVARILEVPEEFLV